MVQAKLSPNKQPPRRWPPPKPHVLVRRNCSSISRGQTGLSKQLSKMHSDAKKGKEMTKSKDTTDSSKDSSKSSTLTDGVDIEEVEDLLGFDSSDEDPAD